MTFSLSQALLLFVIGLGIVLFSAEQLVDGVEKTATLWGVSGFGVAAALVGFDPENLFVGAAGTFEGLPGIAMGSVLGALMVAVALAFGITAYLAPLKFDDVSPRVLISAPAALALLWALSLDGLLSRIDGALLVGAFLLALYHLYYAARRGLDLRAPRAHTATTTPVEGSRWRALMVLLGSLAGIVVGSEMLVRGARPFLRRAGVSDTLFGMTLLALLVSVEELARELPAALRGRPDITVGNVIGSALHFLLLNAGVIALVHPVKVARVTRYFHFPAAGLTLLVVVLMVMRRRVGRIEGLLLVMLYGGFVAGSVWW